MTDIAQTDQLSRKIDAEIGKMLAETARLQAEIGKMMEETRKITVDIQKTKTETTWHPFLAGAALFGAAIGFVKLFL
ncbi:MAG: hypothetical protein LBD67_05675 [Candidatus Accumulibacter sp.]|jgi:hypothetical protein|nr:hypothetical protein [Accumulibacter sp.]